MNASSGKFARPLRVVMTKVGLDGHDRGVKVIAQALRDAGMEVIYAGLRRTPEEIAEIVLQEDADVLGLSILSGAVVPLTRKVLDALKAREIDDVLRRRRRHRHRGRARRTAETRRHRHFWTGLVAG